MYLWPVMSSQNVCCELTDDAKRANSVTRAIEMVKSYNYVNMYWQVIKFNILVYVIVACCELTTNGVGANSATRAIEMVNYYNHAIY